MPALEAACLDDLLWGLAAFTPPVISKDTPIEALLNLCSAKSVDLDCTITIPPDRIGIYEDSAEVQTVILSTHPDLAKAFQMVKADGTCDVQLSTAFPLIRALLHARGKRIEHDYLSSNDLIPRLILREAEYRPVHTAWLSAQPSPFFASVVDDYLDAFKDGNIMWESNMLLWSEQHTKVMEYLKSMARQYREFWIGHDHFKESGMLPVEVLLLLEQEGMIVIGEVRQRDDGTVELKIAMAGRSSESDKAQEKPIRYLNIWTDFRHNRIWSDDNEREEGMQGNAATTHLWHLLLTHKGEDFDHESIRKILRQKTKREAEVLQLDLDSVLDNVIDKLVRISGEKRKHVIGWFNRTGTTLSLKDID